MRICAVIVLLACAAASRATTYTTYIAYQYQVQVSAIAADSSGDTYVTGRSIGGPPFNVFVNELGSGGNFKHAMGFGGSGANQANSIAVDGSGNIYIAGVAYVSDIPLYNPVQGTANSSAPAGTGFLMKLAPNGSVIYSTYLGGTQGASALVSVAADAQGNAYVTGWTAAADYQHTAGLPAATVSGGPVLSAMAAFFAKLSPAGQLVYAGGLAGQPSCGAVCQAVTVTNQGVGIAVDGAGNAYIAGNAAAGLPTTSDVVLATGIGAFVAKVNANGTGLGYLTYLGAGQQQPGIGLAASDTVAAIAVNSAGDAYVSGNTTDPAFPVTAGAYQTKLSSTSGPDAFVAEINPTGSAMVWATLLGGSQTNFAQTIVIDSAGDVWVSGTTTSSDFPVTAPVDPSGSEFLTEVKAGGSTLVYLALFPQGTVAQGLALDATGTLHMAGSGGIISAAPAGTPPSPAAGPWIFGLANSAGGLLSGRLAPGELISIYGLNLGPASGMGASYDSAGFLPTTLGGVQVAINGVKAPLLWASSTQINAIVPMETPSTTLGQLQVTVNGTPLSAFEAWVDPAAPGVFVAPWGGAAAINQDGTLNTSSNPAPDGSYVSIWTTGTGYFPGSDGQMATAANPFCGVQMSKCGIYESTGGLTGVTPTPVNVYYSGAAPGIVNGVVQINFQVNSAAQFGYYMDVDGFNSLTFTVCTAP